ncbi:hypothetical protein KY284_026215 [Solanum tuberosum]|nr:hypothetical protein KY284_026215 [Solanum tuberosum]
MMYEEDDANLDGVGATGAIMLHALPPGMFRGAAGDDANQHLMNFVAICKSQEIPGVNQTTMRLRMFPLSLTGEATNWMNEMLEDSIRTWIELKEAFLERFFPESKEPQMKDEIMCGGSFMRKPFSESMQLMDDVSKNNRAWYTRDAKVGDLGYKYELSAEQRKREEDRDRDIAHMRTQIDILTKQLVSKSEKVEIRLGNDNMLGQQIESRETGRTEMGTRMIVVVFMCPQVIEIGQVVFPAGLSWKT